MFLFGVIAASCPADLQRLVSTGDLYAARRAALAHCTRTPPPPPPTFSSSAPAPRLGFIAEQEPQQPSALASLDAKDRSACAASYAAHVDVALSRLPDHGTSLVARAHAQHASPSSWLPQLSDCFAGEYRSHQWERCCSSLGSVDSRLGCDDLGSVSCCAVGNRSRNFLHLPALHELWTQLRLPTGRLLHVEQDGWLRPFDTATVLWPAGYLLAQWAGGSCARLRGAQVIELGAGTGAASVAAALCGASVLATDGAARSLQLVAANAALAGVSDRVSTLRLDWDDDAAVDRAASRGPFDLLLGAALQPERWEQRLWTVVGRLLGGGGGGAARRPAVVLAHSAGAIGSPPHSSGLQLGARVPGVALGLHTRWKPAWSDFELVELLHDVRAGAQHGCAIRPSSVRGLSMASASESARKSKGRLTSPTSPRIRRRRGSDACRCSRRRRRMARRRAPARCCSAPCRAARAPPLPPSTCCPMPR